MVEEYWDIYDADRNLSGRTIKRGEPLKAGEFYVCCEIWIVNSNHQILVTQRHPDKKAGGLWEFTGGGVLAGETTRLAACRELKEELGILCKEAELELLGIYSYGHYFMDIYVVRKDLRNDEIVLDKNEVTDWLWLSSNDVENLIETGKMVHSVGMRYKAFANGLLYT